MTTAAYGTLFSPLASAPVSIRPDEDSVQGQSGRDTGSPSQTVTPWINDILSDDDTIASSKLSKD